MCKVSVVIPYYNSEKTIIRALESVINQTYKDFEIILINDGSTDNSYKIVEKFIKNHSEYNMVHLNQTNSGPSKARNKGISASKGKYIALLDSDDSWDINKLDIQVEFMEKNEDIYILGSDWRILCRNEWITKGKNINKFQENTFYLRLFKNTFCTSTVIIKKVALNVIGGFNENQKYAEDTLLYLKILRKFRGGKIQLPLTYCYKMDYGEGGLSQDLRQLEKYELKNFRGLRNENDKYDKKISGILYFVIVAFSLIKYLRRIMIVHLKK